MDYLARLRLVVQAARTYLADQDDGHQCGGKSGEWCSGCWLKWELRQLDAEFPDKKDPG